MALFQFIIIEKSIKSSQKLVELIKPNFWTHSTLKSSFHCYVKILSDVFSIIIYKKLKYLIRGWTEAHLFIYLFGFKSIGSTLQPSLFCQLEYFLWQITRNYSSISENKRFETINLEYSTHTKAARWFSNIQR